MAASQPGEARGSDASGKNSSLDSHEQARRLAAAADDPTGWFERLYSAAASGEAGVPWDRGEPHPLLVGWLKERTREPRDEARPDAGAPPPTEQKATLPTEQKATVGAERRATVATGRRAVVVGAGLGEDAEFVSRQGWETVAFDISESAVRAAKRRFPHSIVDYRVADLFAVPDEWHEAFDLVVESMTVQSLPPDLHPQAIAHVRRLLAPGGTLLVIGMVGDPERPADGPPWPLTRTEIDGFASDDVRIVRLEEVADAGRPDVRWWRAEFVRCHANAGSATR